MEECFCPQLSEDELLDSLEVMFDYNKDLTIEESVERYIMDEVDPTGWHGLWKPSRYTRKDLGIKEARKYFKVQVIEVQFLEADVCILESNQELRVPLHQLFTLFDQPENVDDVRTAGALEVIRSLIEYIWQPWDTAQHIRSEMQNRVEVYFSMKSGNIGAENSRKIRTLVEDAWYIDKSLKTLMPADDENVEAAEIVKMTKLNLRLENIRNELEYLENPCIRHYLPSNLNGPLEDIDSSGTQQILVVGRELQLSAMSELVEFVRSTYPSQSSYSFMPDLETALSHAAPNDVLCLSEGSHRFTALGPLCSGGEIIGMSAKSSLSCEGAGDVVMVVTNGSLKLKNLSIDGSLRSYVIVVHPDAEVIVEDCVISNAAVGILVFPGGRADAKNCSVSLVDIGLEARNHSHVRLNKSIIEKCDVALKVEEGGKVDMEDGELRQTLVASLHVTLNDGNTVTCKKGDISQLQMLGSKCPIHLKDVTLLPEAKVNLTDASFTHL